MSNAPAPSNPSPWRVSPTVAPGSLGGEHYIQRGEDLWGYAVRGSAGKPARVYLMGGREYIPASDVRALADALARWEGSIQSPHLTT